MNAICPHAASGCNGPHEGECIGLCDPDILARLARNRTVHPDVAAATHRILIDEAILQEQKIRAQLIALGWTPPGWSLEQELRETRAALHGLLNALVAYDDGGWGIEPESEAAVTEANRVSVAYARPDAG